MANPRPKQTEEFKAKRFHQMGDNYGELAPKIVGVRLPVEEYDAIVALGKEKTPWLRRVIVEAARKELMNSETENVDPSQSTDEP